MDDFSFIILGGVGALLIALFALGKWYPGSGADIEREVAEHLRDQQRRAAQLRDDGSA